MQFKFHYKGRFKTNAKPRHVINIEITLHLYESLCHKDMSVLKLRYSLLLYFTRLRIHRKVSILGDIYVSIKISGEFCRNLRGQIKRLYSKYNHLEIKVSNTFYFVVLGGIQ